MKMNKAAFDTGFFVEFYYSQDHSLKQKMTEKKKIRGKYVSAIVIHELYNLSLVRQGREVAETRTASIKEEFEILPVDDQVAQISAELRHKYNLSMGDSMIAATAFILKAVCITDDPHFIQIKEIEAIWI